MRDYLLSQEHPVGLSKARFFESLGFTRADWPALQSALIQEGRDGAVELGAASVFRFKGISSVVVFMVHPVKLRSLSLYRSC